MQPVAAVQFEFLVVTEVVPSLKQSDSGNTGHHRDHSVGIGRNRRERGAIVRGCKRGPDHFVDLAALVGKGLHHPSGDLMSPGVIRCNEGDVAGTQFLVEIIAKGVANLAGRHRGSDDGRQAVPLGRRVSTSGVHDQRDPGFFADLSDRGPLMTAKGPDDEVDLVLKRQSAPLSEGLVGIACGVCNHQLDLTSSGHVVVLFPEHLHTVEHFSTWCRKRPRNRGQHTNPDGGLLRQRVHGREQGEWHSQGR